ncbi:MAG: hypothetical protein LBO78_02855 [Rickettsiales bacterium]|jgi:uncharacterized protein YuzB (UPF0349 family)|nr:hypothetical protein [Rickettsiales bacterium]
MKPPKIIIIVLINLLSGSGGVFAALKDDLAATLEEHCIPKCESGCSKSFLAEYDAATGECKCGANLTYDPGLRDCIVKCPVGTYAHRGTGCPGGTYKIGNTDEHGVMAGTACPAGSYKITIE